MTESTPSASPPPRRRRGRRRCSNALVFGWRAVLKFRHVPEQLFDLVMTPIMFTLLFTFVFGGALAGSTRGLPAVLPPGILVQTVAFNSVYSGMGLSTDLRQGALRPLPHAADLAAGAVRRADGGRRAQASDRRRPSSSASGWSSAIGRRRASSGVAAAFALLLAIGFGMGWVFIVLGLLIRTPTTVMTRGVHASSSRWSSPRTSWSSPATMPGWLRAVRRGEPDLAG